MNVVNCLVTSLNISHSPATYGAVQMWFDWLTDWLIDLWTDSRNKTMLFTNVVSQSSLLPCIKLPIVMLKYVVPLLQLDILVNGYTARISCNRTNYIINGCLCNVTTSQVDEYDAVHNRTKQTDVSSKLTLVTGSMRFTPCLLIAISSISGKVGSVVCCNQYQQR